MPSVMPEPRADSSSESGAGALPSQPLGWPVQGSRRGAEHGIYRIRHDVQRSPRTGTAFDRVVIEAADWINVIALTEERQMVLVRQFRFGRRGLTLEIPGGMVDQGESPADAARRELLEETGYGGGRWTCLGAVEPNPAMQDNLCFHYLAEDVLPLAQIEPDGGEDIEIILIPLEEGGRLVAEGAIRHSLVISALSRVLDLRSGPA